MKKLIYPLLIFIFVKSNFLFAQDEQLVPLTNNPVLINEWKRINSEHVIQKVQSASNDTLLLPFIDDFSAQWMFPKSDLWTDSTAFINSDFALHPPTIGVATFDGLNKFGNPYFAVSSADGWCDVLTSKPINTYDDGQGNPYNPSLGLFFSFFYEQKGYGDRPESGDAFYLQFRDNTGLWNDMQTINGGSAGLLDSTFTRVQITITDQKYFYKGFRFRFRNWGSLTGNVDHWHLDYVTLKAPPYLSNINDVAYVTPGRSLLNDLTAMPYTHYKNGTIAPSALMRSNMTYTMHNNNDTFDKICRFVDKIYDPSGVEIFCNGCTAGSNNFQVNHQSTLNYNFPFASFDYPAALSQSTVAFDVVNHIESTSGGPLDDNAQNDTIHYLQKFYNYYAHDDGTAEQGYNLNAAGAQLAYKFHVNKTDDLHAVQFYFTQIGASVANELFKIVVWNDAGGVPGAIVYQKINQVPAYSNIIDGFVTYNVTTTTLPAGDYFFGFIQNNNVQLNIGFDANIVTPPSLKYYKTTGAWTQSNFAGSWMIRPVFTPFPFNVGLNEAPPVNILSVYPNPVSSILHLDYDMQEKPFQYELTDASGRVIAIDRLQSNSIDVSKFMNGFYVLRVFDEERKNVFQEKIIIYH